MEKNSTTLNKESVTEARRRRLTGVVVRRSGDKTVAVEIKRVMRDPLYGKTIARTKRYLVHDEGNKAEVGQTVEIEESRPLSKRKRWVVVSSKA